MTLTVTCHLLTGHSVKFVNANTPKASPSEKGKAQPNKVGCQFLYQFLVN